MKCQSVTKPATQPMSTQQRSAQQSSHREQNTTESKHKSSPSKKLDDTSDATITYQVPKDFDLGTTSLPVPTIPKSTKTLQDEEDGKLANALTTYNEDHRSSAHSGLASLLHLFKPIDFASINTSTNDILSNLPSSLHTSSSPNAFSNANAFESEEAHELTALRTELEEHFRRLKREFEAKTGRSWTPLRPWANEEWEWNDDVVSEKDIVFD
ncbi:hypothetical protein EJ02DRAFT_492216 [Clathrospora elynae]|uniref:Uncharacterized protein n=1 Tax=Clathrospora elynae TaxID=706981 RepID=A0A6A5SSI5_9PLEO|nr:hypothetical protein EJ02DRAFT_492216 [Clathrospora elynae]